jgi:predicted Zn-dependent peptidase
MTIGIRGLGAQTQSLPVSVQSNVLANGMEVLLREIPGSGSVYIGLVFRGGAEAQSNKNAGQLRLLEYFLFRGLASYPGEPEPAGALEAIGAISPQGGAELDRFGFSFSVRPEFLPQALDTLAQLFSSLRLETAFRDPEAFQEARDSSLLALSQSAADPAAVFEAALARKMFAAAPWRLDIPGADYIVAATTKESLAALASAWLVPNNSALVVAGDFSASDTMPLIEQAFGSWKKSTDPWKIPPASLPKPGVVRPTLMVYSDPQVPAGEAVMEIRYRGPDNSTALYPAAVLWNELAATKDGRMAQALRKALPQSADPREIQTAYKATRSVSWFSVSARVSFDSRNNPADMAMTFKETVRGSEMYAMKTNPAYFSQASYESAISALLERRMARLSDPAEAGMLISDGWIQGGAAWIRNWPDRISKVRQKEIAAFADEYFMRNLEIVAVRVNPADYAARKKTFDSYGFEQLAPAKAFWWK